MSWVLARIFWACFVWFLHNQTVFKLSWNQCGIRGCFLFSWFNLCSPFLWFDLALIYGRLCFTIIFFWMKISILSKCLSSFDLCLTWTFCLSHLCNQCPKYCWSFLIFLQLLLFLHFIPNPPEQLEFFGLVGYGTLILWEYSSARH